MQAICFELLLLFVSQKVPNIKRRTRERGMQYTFFERELQFFASKSLQKDPDQSQMENPFLTFFINNFRRF